MNRCCLRGVVAANGQWNETKLVEADFENANVSFAFYKARSCME